MYETMISISSKQCDGGEVRGQLGKRKGLWRTVFDGGAVRGAGSSSCSDRLASCERSLFLLNVEK